MSEYSDRDAVGIGLPTGFTLTVFNEIDSTNSEACRRAEMGAGHGTVIQALHQSAGRGRRGRSWVSQSGNLFFSVLIDPACSLLRAAQLSFVASLAVAEALSRLAPAVEIRCKWPNDILCNDRKIAGILLEPVNDLMIIGIGVNLAHHPVEALYPATSLSAWGFYAKPGDVLREIVAHLDIWLRSWWQDGFDPIRHAWLQKAKGLDQPVVARLGNGCEQSGRFLGLDEQGALLLACDSSGDIKRVFAGDIFFSNHSQCGPG